MTRYGVEHRFDLDENTQAVNDYLDSIGVNLQYAPSTFQGKTMPPLDWFLAHTDEISQIWSQDISTSEKLAQVTSDAASTSAMVTPEDFTRQAYAFLFNGDAALFNTGREGYAASDYTYSSEYTSSYQKGMMDLLHILQTPALQDSIEKSFLKYRAAVQSCTDEEGDVDLDCMRATAFPQCSGTMMDLLLDQCTTSIVLTPEMRAAGIDNVYSFYQVFFRLLTTLSEESSREVVATVVTDIYGAQQTIIYHLPEVNLAMMAVLNSGDSSINYDPASQDIVLTRDTPAFRSRWI